jgi:hypothetical protein
MASPAVYFMFLLAEQLSTIGTIISPFEPLDDTLDMEVMPTASSKESLLE